MSEGQPHLRIHKWDELQHYKDREPPWIKLYNRLLDHYEFGRLSDAVKGHYLGLLMLRSRHGEPLPLDVDWLASRINATEPLDLRPLVSAGLIELYHDDSVALYQDDSTPQAFARSREAETETEAENRDGGSLPNGRSPPGEPAEETTPKQDRSSLAGTLRSEAQLGRSGDAVEANMRKSLDIADELHDEGYSYTDQEDAVRGARLMIQNREDAFRGWIGPGETFGMGIFRHAKEQGVKLIETCKTYWYKHGAEVSESGVGAIEATA